MIAVVQRVSSASVTVDSRIVGEINLGLLVLAAVHREDTDADAQWMASKLLGLRVFPNGEKSFDLDVAQAGGSLLVVSNFTVAAETKTGRRPSLSPAAGPEHGRVVFDSLLEHLRRSPIKIEPGEFGGDMRVAITNEGPATFILNSRE